MIRFICSETYRRGGINIKFEQTLYINHQRSEEEEKNKVVSFSDFMLDHFVINLYIK